MYSFAVHKMLDYSVALAVLILAMVVANVPAALHLFVGAAVLQLVYTLATRGPFSPHPMEPHVPRLPLLPHFALDLATGFAFLLAPWVLNYATALTTGQLAVHVATGMSYLALPALTNRRKPPVWDEDQIPMEDIVDMERHLKVAGRR